MSRHEDEVMKLLKNFIDMGLREDFSKLRDYVLNLPASIRDGQIMRESRIYWKQVAEALTTEDLIALIKTMTRAEGIVVGFGGGSVTPGIWLFNELVARTRHANDELADWVLRQGKSEYLPWGSNNFGARSLDEYKLRKKAYEEKKRIKEDAREKDEALARLTREVESTKKIWQSIKGGDVKAVKSLAAKGADLTATNEDGLRPVEYAIKLGRLEIASIIEEYVNMNEKDKK